MKLYHKKPCKECPWRLIAPSGWLGGYTPEQYADAVNNNEIPACHLQDHGPNSDATAMCAGALGTMSNQCKSAYNTEGGDSARTEVGKNPDCFQHIADFYQHHADRVYVHPFLRENHES